MRKLAIDIGISEGTVRNIVKKELKLKPYKIQKTYLLNDKMKTNRAQKCKAYFDDLQMVNTKQYSFQMKNY